MQGGRGNTVSSFRSDEHPEKTQAARCRLSHSEGLTSTGTPISVCWGGVEGIIAQPKTHRILCVRFSFMEPKLLRCNKRRSLLGDSRLDDESHQD